MKRRESFNVPKNQFIIQFLKPQSWWNTNLALMKSDRNIFPLAQSNIAWEPTAAIKWASERRNVYIVSGLYEDELRQVTWSTKVKSTSNAISLAHSVSKFAKGYCWTCLIPYIKAINGVIPFLSCALIFAPCSSNNAANFQSPTYSAAWSGVQPLTS